jgi:hypothetical protein
MELEVYPEPLFVLIYRVHGQVAHEEYRSYEALVQRETEITSKGIICHWINLTLELEQWEEYLREKSMV